MESKDRRIRKTKEAITSAFLNVAEVKPLEKITVTEIIEIADISRSTFYLHYTDIPELYQSLIDNLTADIVGQLNRYYPANLSLSFENLVEHIFEYTRKHEQLLKIVIKTRNLTVVNKLQQLLTQKIIEIEKLDGTDDYVYYDVVWIVSGIIGIIIDWINNDQPQTYRQLTNTVTRIVNDLSPKQNEQY